MRKFKFIPFDPQLAGFNRDHPFEHQGEEKLAEGRTITKIIFVANKIMNLMIGS